MTGSRPLGSASGRPGWHADVIAPAEDAVFLVDRVEQVGLRASALSDEPRNRKPPGRSA